MKKKTLGITSSLLLLSTQLVLAQESVNASGGDLTGSNGTVAYSVGQPFYNINGTSNSATVSEGVQQPFDLTVGVDEISGIDITMAVYPNPAYDVVNLTTDTWKESLSLRLMDATGKLLSEQKITQEETQISVVDLPVGTYYLEVFLESNRFKTITLIKH